MILDANLIFSKDQAVTQTGASSNTIDLQVPGDAVGQELTFHAVVSRGFAGLTNLQIKIQTSADKNAWEDVLMSAVIPLAKLKAGKEIFKVRTPSGLDRYVRLQYQVTGTGTAGAIYAYLSKEQ